MSLNYEVRRATAKDLEKVYEFICELEETKFDLSLFRKYYLENIKSSGNVYLVATINNEVIAFLSCHSQILLHHLGKVYEIQELFVKETRRNNGVGKLLLKELEKEISKEDYQMLEVTSNIKREETHRFYTNNGFKNTHYKFTNGLNKK